MALILAALFGYVCGSIPFGLILTRIAGTKDLRSIGSGNIGATNVLRTGRKDLAALTLLADALKGVIAVLIAARWGQPDNAAAFAIAASFGAFFGHVFPIWLKFKGGKGVATFLGCLLALFWPSGFAFIAVWLAVAFMLRYSSAAALMASMATPIVAVVLGRFDIALACLVLSALLWFTHRENIMRLIKGEESKIAF